MRHDRLHSVLDRLAAAEGQENDSRVRIERVHMADAVLLLGLDRQLMLFDGAVHIVIDGRAADNARLTSAVHRETVDVIARLIVRDVCSVRNARVHCLRGLLIDLRAVGIGSLRKINLRPVNVKEGHGVILDHLPCLL